MSRLRVMRMSAEELERRQKEGTMYADLVPIGKWIDPKPHLVSPYAKRYKCDQCGEWAYRTDFCPNCGSDMREGDAE